MKDTGLNPRAVVKQIPAFAGIRKTRRGAIHRALLSCLRSFDLILLFARAGGGLHFWSTGV